MNKSEAIIEFPDTKNIDIKPVTAAHALRARKFAYSRIVHRIYVEIHFVQLKWYHLLVDPSLQISLKFVHSKVSDASHNSTIKCPVIFCDIYIRAF